MNTAGANELGYASAAILGALLDRLIVGGVLSATDAAAVLDNAAGTLSGFGNLTFVPGSLRVVGDVKAQLAKHGVRQTK